MSDPSIYGMNVLSSKEPFVDLIYFDSDIIVDQTLSTRTDYFSFVRLSVAEKHSLAKSMLPKGYGFYIKEGLRPFASKKQLLSDR
ncbi:hypothetical protein [Cytobacillus purgationiresistens]|uniref:Uncharacterized protein n=1 Tax=Cytobacillus purgationiresistens TaxID=863449 RepID=A0ABU0AI79_9BACI|nr:hypothetical protein [Cytobacillus purgationiresistens]MDQ0270958.1 hypothetical protein [Cytobacillus purgationiresistens]